jgi:Tachylectin
MQDQNTHSAQRGTAVCGSTTRDSRRASARLAAFAAALAVLVPATASSGGSRAAAQAASVACATPGVPMYHVDGANQLRRWSFASPSTGASGWTQAQIGTGWAGLGPISGGDGVIYAVDSSGDLRWYQDENYAGGAADWNPNSGDVIGTGWGAFTSVLSGGDGVIYAVDPSGDLHWYQYTGTDGAGGSGGSGDGLWAPGSGTVIGTGWGGFTQIFAGGDGIIYAVDSAGDLWWYRHLEPTAGSASWAAAGGGSMIGTGWSQFTQFGSMGGGIIFARDASGGLWWYRHADPLGGSDTWADGGGRIGEGTGWGPGSIVADVDGCTASSD